MTLIDKSARAGSKWATIIYKLKIGRWKFLMQVLMNDFVQLSSAIVVFSFLKGRMGTRLYLR